MTLKSNISKLVNRWVSEGVEILPPENELSVRKVFKNGTVTADVLVLYEALGGMVEMNNEHLRIWSLKEVEDSNLEPCDKGILFADYCLDCYQYRLKFANQEISEVWFDDFSDPPIRIANSLQEFFERYLVNPDFVLNAPAR
jgi:hypothetical protein